MSHFRSFFLFALLASSLHASSISAVDESPHYPCSSTTIRNGDLAYPPSFAMIDVLQRSGYLSLPETQKYLQQYKAPLFRLLSPYYIVQRNGTSCSLATATMILNAARQSLNPNELAKPATQNEVLEMVNDPLWDAATGDEGPGVTLEQYGFFLRKMFASYGLKKVEVEVVYVQDTSEETKRKIHEDLLATANEHETKVFLALDFDDATFISIPISLGHISPVGGYDPSTKLVLILDVDREWTGPYWISEETMIKGLNTLDETEGLTKPTYRGYIRITLPS